MLRQTAIADIGLDNIIARLTLAVTLLKELNDAFGPPFVQPISNTIESLLQIVQVWNSKHGRSSNLLVGWDRISKEIKANVLSWWRTFTMWCMQLLTSISSLNPLDRYLPQCWTALESLWSMFGLLKGDLFMKFSLRTLHKTYIFIEVQQDRHKIKHLFRNNEMHSLLKDCCAGLDQAVEVFGVWSGIILWESTKWP